MKKESKSPPWQRALRIHVGELILWLITVIFYLTLLKDLDSKYALAMFIFCILYLPFVLFRIVRTFLAERSRPSS